MTIIAPTITTDQPTVYQQRLTEFMQFAPVVHIDITDGEFAPSRTINLNQLYWPNAGERDCQIELHLMMRQPIAWLNQIISLKPDRVIVQAESNEANNVLPKLFDHLAKFDIPSGIALLQSTAVATAMDLIGLSDSVLVFGGRLGYQGGQADLGQLIKVSQIRSISPSSHIEWDGGANLTNVHQIACSGVDQINIGQAIESASNWRGAYDKLAGAAQADQSDQCMI